MPTQAQVSAQRPLHVPAACSFQVWKSDKVRAPLDFVTMPLHVSPATILYHWLQLDGTDKWVSPGGLVDVTTGYVAVAVAEVVVAVSEGMFGWPFKLSLHCVM